jgi:hypothetical protein
MAEEEKLIHHSAKEGGRYKGGIDPRAAGMPALLVMCWTGQTQEHSEESLCHTYAES